ncbi:MAG: hypothetical protein LBF51_09970 [Zoogloeaceae bacterium]|nr:hypothetical protein [Zoogloeaceae bacterium]
MKLRDYIGTGTEKTGSQKALAEHLGLYAEDLRGANRGKRGLPNDACIKLAKIIDADPLEVIAASELATEKKPEKRAFWLPFVEHAKAASILALAVTASLMTNGTEAKDNAQVNPAFTRQGSLVRIQYHPPITSPMQSDKGRKFIQYKAFGLFLVAQGLP